MIQPDAFMDTNVLLRHVLQDHVEHSPLATVLVTAIERGERVVRIADTVVLEAGFTLEKTYRAPRQAISNAVLPILDLPGVVLPGKRVYGEVFGWYVERPGLSFADCYHLALTKQLDLPSIISFDRQLGGVPVVTRIDP